MSDAPLVGYVVGEVRTDAFSFVTNPELAPPRLEYVCVRGVKEPGGDGPRHLVGEYHTYVLKAIRNRAKKMFIAN